MRFKAIILFFATFCFFYGTFAQQVSEEKFKRGTLFYYIHVIQKGETIGSLALTYKVSTKEIEEVNPGLNPDKVRDGQKVIIPNYSNFIKDYPREKWSFELYKVQSGDKLKSIAKQFGSEAKNIKEINPGIENKPTAGSEIRVPVPRKVGNMVVKEPQNKADSSKKNPALGFDWGKEDKGKDVDKDKAEKPKNCNTYKYDNEAFNITILMPVADKKLSYGLAFIEGALLAVEEMKNSGLSVNLNITDVSAENVNKLATGNTLDGNNLIIGPFSLSLLKPLAAKARDKEIPFVSPYEAKAADLVKNNPYFIQVYPSDEALYAKMLTEVQSDANVVLVMSETPDSVMLSNYKKTLVTKFPNYKEYTHTIVKSKAIGLTEMLVKDKKNLVFVCSNNESFVNDVLNRLNALVKYNISVYGRAKWKEFKLIEPSRYFDLNLHMVQPFAVDYSNNDVKDFIRNYRRTYNNEPSQYAFQGYDVTYYFLAVLKKYGSSFLPCFSTFNSTGLQSRFKFSQPDKDGGFINSGCFDIEYNSDIEINRK